MAVRREHRLEVLQVVEAGEIGERSLAAEGAGLELEQRAVIAVAGHEQLAAAGDDAGHGERQRAGLGARIGEAHLLHRGDARDEERAERALRHVARGPARAAGQLPRRGLDHGGIGVAMHHRRIVVDQVDVPVAVDVPQVHALGALDGERIGRPVARLARRAARHDRLRPGMGLGAPLRAFEVARAYARRRSGVLQRRRFCLRGHGSPPYQS